MVSGIIDELRNLPVMFVGTARPELSEMWRPALTHHNGVLLNIDPLSREDAALLLAALLGSQPTPDLEAALLERGGGNPFFLEELAALLVDGAPDVGELPATLRGLVAARLDALSSPERALLDDAAVVGRRGTLLELGALAEARGETDWAAMVDILTGRELLSVDGEEVAFRSDLVREVAYETLTKADRARRHATLARRLADRPNPDPDHLAYHYGVAAQLARELGTIDGVPPDIEELALAALERAATRAISRDLHLAGMHHLDLALELTGPTGPAARRIRLARAGARAALHDLDGARADLELARREAEAADDEAGVARALTVLGEVQHKEGACAEAVETLQQAVTRWRAIGDARGEADALRQLGMSHIWAGNADDADQPIRSALEISRRLGDRRGEAWALQNLAWIAFERGEAELADERLHKAIDAFSDVSDYGGMGWALGLLGWVRFYQGRLADAEQLALRILDELDGTGERWGLGMMALLMASVRLWQGRTQEAIDRASAALEEFRAMGDGGGEFRALTTLARGLVALGRVGDGVAALRRAQAMAPGLSESMVHQIDGMLASVSAQIGDVSLAPEGEVLVGAPLEGPSNGFAEVASQQGLVSLQRGDVDLAVHQLESAEGAVSGSHRRPFAISAIALAYAAAGRGDDALAVASGLAELQGTYLDRAMTAAARGFAAAQDGSLDRAEAAFAEGLAAVDTTDDVLAQAVVRLAYGRALEALDAPLATPVLVDARSRLNTIGITASGWDTAFRLAAAGRRPKPSSVSA
ncbi:MAG: hypothetical protein QOG64_736, partial [Acidimicrobiaceae bacterium]|nr:hypothetical protein [Acidimicrobiaceae bacterium]